MGRCGKGRCIIDDMAEPNKARRGKNINMEIQAKLSFKHGRVMRVLDSAGMSVKELSIRCGWDYQNLLAFVSFKRLPKCENHDSLLYSLQSIDPTITETEVFPEQYDQVKDVLQTRLSSKDIPLANLLSFNLDSIAIEDKTLEAVGYNLDMNKMISEVGDILEGRELNILSLYFGIRGEKPHTLEKIANLYRLSPNRVGQIKENALKKLKSNNRFKKYKEIGADEIEEGQFSTCNMPN